MLTMMQATHWESRDSVIQYLAKQLKSSTISLVLGSGISTSFGLPDWDTLILELSKGYNVPKGFSRLSAKQQATIIRKDVFNNDISALNNEIRNVLYNNASIDFESLQKEMLLVSLGALLMASSRGSVSNVITFNYDDILETYLSFFGYTCESAIDGVTWVSNKDVVVHHPHGFMPNDFTKPIQGEVVLDSSSFHSIMKDGSHWKNKLFSILSSTFPIFIGVSGNDEHLQNHLEECKNNHVSIVQDKIPYWGIWFTTDSNSAIAKIWEDLKVYPFELSSWDELPQVLFKICQVAAKP